METDGSFVLTEEPDLDGVCFFFLYAVSLIVFVVAYTPRKWWGCRCSSATRWAGSQSNAGIFLRSCLSLFLITIFV
jgi:hypothetical protein